MIVHVNKVVGADDRLERMWYQALTRVVYVVEWDRSGRDVVVTAGGDIESLSSLEDHHKEWVSPSICKTAPASRVNKGIVKLSYVFNQPREESNQ